MESLQQMPDELISWLADHTSIAAFSRGEVLIEESTSTRNCYFIISGETDVLFEGRSLGPTGAGQPEGEMAMFFRQPRSATTVANSDTVTVLNLPAAAFDELQRTNPELANRFQDRLLSYLERARGITSLDAQERARRTTADPDQEK